MRFLKGPGLVLLQGASQIIEKSLAEGEEIQAPYLSLVAYGASVGLVKSRSGNSWWSFLTRNWLVLELKGPGTVYLCPHESAESRKESHLEGDILIMLSFLYTIFRLLTVTVHLARHVMKLYDK